MESARTQENFVKQVAKITMKREERKKNELMRSQNHIEALIMILKKVTNNDRNKLHLSFKYK